MVFSLQPYARWSGGAPTGELPLPSPSFRVARATAGSCEQLLVVPELAVHHLSKPKPAWQGAGPVIVRRAWSSLHVSGVSRFPDQIKIQNLHLCVSGVCYGFSKSLF